MITAAELLNAPTPFYQGVSGHGPRKGRSQYPPDHEGLRFCRSCPPESCWHPVEQFGFEHRQDDLRRRQCMTCFRREQAEFKRIRGAK